MRMGKQKTSNQTSPSPADIVRLEDLYTKNKQALDELRGLVSEAHGVLKDLRSEVKKAQQVLPMIVSRRINVEVEKQITKLGEETEQAMDDAAAKVYAEFDRLQAMILGKEDPDKPSLDELITRLGPLLPLLQGIISGELQPHDIGVHFKEERKGSILDERLPPDTPWRSDVPAIPAGEDRFA